MERRVVAIQKSNDTTVWSYGGGVYEGNEVPPETVSYALHHLGVKNPKIKLDSGKVIYGCECWWFDESDAKAWIRGREVIVL